MIPQIFSIGPLPVNSFGLTIALALFAGIVVMQRSFIRYGLDAKLAESYVITAAVVGIIGARILYLIENYQEVKGYFWQAAFSSAGFTFYGGFILAAIVLIVKAHFKKISVAKLAAAAAPAVALGYAIGRLGCQLSGDGDYGKEVLGFLGMSYATGVVPTPPGVLVYPTPVYESFICILIAIYIYRLEEKPSWRETPLKLFGLTVILLSLERFFVEFLRINPLLLFGLSEAQLIAIALFVIGGFCMLFQGQRYSRA